MADISRWEMHMELVKAGEQAGKLEETARIVRNESQRVDTCRSEVRQAWESDNATRFMGKMGLFSEDLKKIANQLDHAADEIRKNARRKHDT